MENAENSTHINHIFSVDELEKIKNSISAPSLLYGFEDRLIQFCSYFKSVFKKHFPKDFRKFFNTTSWYGENTPIFSELNNLPEDSIEKIFWLAIIENTLNRIDIYESKVLEFNIVKADPEIIKIKVVLEMFCYKVLEKYKYES